MRRLLLACAFLLSALPARAERVCFIGYDTFMTMVPSAEIEICPGQQIRADQGFCRIGLVGHEVLLYVFRRVEAEPCLAQVIRYTLDEFVARFGTSYLRP